MLRRPDQIVQGRPVRYLSFAERLGPTNAKSIVLHYLAVVLLSYLIWWVRGQVLEAARACSDPDQQIDHWAARVICFFSESDNFILFIIKTYLDFSSYYIILGIVILNTIVILVLAKHLWKALWIKEDKSVKKTKTGKAKLDASVVIDMFEEDCGVVCMDDNFFIELILAAFDFFRVSETKQE